MSSLEHLSQAPLELDAFPKNLLRHVDPKAPPPLRDMGAKGLVPGISPDQLAMVLYQLRFDPEEGFRNTAAQTFQDLPPEMKTTIARAELPAAVLDHCVRAWLGEEALFQLLITNPHMSDASVAWAASAGDARVTDIIADFQTRFMRFPAIVEQLYLNPNTRQSAIDRVLEFALREKLDLSPYPGLEGVVHALTTGGPPSQQQQGAGADDEAFSALLHESVARSEDETRSGVTAEAIDERVEAEEETIKGRQAAIGKMNIAQKVRLATLGSKEDRAILIRDPNRLVHMAALQSPKVDMKDIYDYAGNRNLPEGIINFIAGRRDAMRDYQLLIRLIKNPKLHLKTGLKFLNYVRPSELKSMVKDRNINPQLQKAAKTLLEKRTSGQKG